MTKWLTVCALLSAQWVGAQKLTLATPTRIQALVGHELNVRLKVEGLRKYNIKVEGSPASSQLQNDKFTWAPKAEDVGNYTLKFYLKDTLGVIRDETDIALSVDLAESHPLLLFDKPFSDTVEVVEHEPFFMAATMKSARGEDARGLMVYFLFNESADVRSFDSCEINRMGDQILFGWTPSNREAIRGYAKFRITIVDTDNSVWSHVLNFKIKSINQPPVFKTQISDTVFVTNNGLFTLDFSAVDPDNDKLKYDFTPKSPHYYWEDHKIIFRPESEVADEDNRYPVQLTVSVTDGEHIIKSTTCIRKSKQYQQPSIGDFTQKDFDEGDSILTYLNLTNDSDLKDFDITLRDLVLPPGIGSLASHLAFERGSSYIKVHSNGALPYYLVDRDFTYNIAVTLSAKGKKSKPVFKVLELTVRDRPDPTSMGQQKDSVLQFVNTFLKTENLYKSSLEKIYSNTNRPWWKKAAAITGALSGVLSIVQSQDPNKSVSIVAAGISLMSITVTNLPNLTEKNLSDLTDKIAGSKGRIEQLQEKESDFRRNWSLDIDRASFDKMKAELLERMGKGKEKRQEDVCSLLTNKTLKKKIEKLRNAKAGPDRAEVKAIFSCHHKR